LDETVLETVNRQRPETVQQLVSYVEAGSKAQEKAIIETVLRLQSGGKIRLVKTSVEAPRELSAYLRTEKAFWYWLTLVVAILTVAIVFTVPEGSYPWVYARYVVGAIFVLWLPGYSFMRALFPGPHAPVQSSLKTPENSLDSVEQVALSIGVSLALVPIVGFVLNYTPWGISLTSEISSLLALTVTAATVAVIREHQAQIRQSDTRK
jgi:hypothetical protein